DRAAVSERGGERGEGRRGPFPKSGSGRHAPGWSPAAAEPRKRAARASRPSPRPPPRSLAPPPPPPYSEASRFYPHFLLANARRAARVTKNSCVRFLRASSAVPCRSPTLASSSSASPSKDG